MRLPSIFRRHRALRWFIPVSVAGVVGLAAGGVFTAQASSESLPKTTPAALLADVRAARVSGFSGTIVAQMSLGLPDLPALSGGADGASMVSLMSGSHTLRFWSAGADRQRVALLGATDETDVFRDGRDMWEWHSDTHVATHSVLPATDAAPAAVAELTPRQFADRAIAAIGPSTMVTMARNRRIADRSAYELVLTPRDAATRVGSVRIAIDGTTKMPLGVQVYAGTSTSPAIDVSFSDIIMKKPSAGNFTFTPPPGATVHQGVQAPDAGSVPPPRAGPARVASIGSGWTTIAEYRASPADITDIAGPILGQLTAVHGSWGHGRLLASALVSALVTDDGRVFAGAVDPSALYAAATTHK